MTFEIEANSLGKSYFGDTKNYKAIKVVPSALMRTTSLDFGLESQVVKSVGVYDLDIVVDDDDSSILNIKKLEGHFSSNKGKHYIKLLDTMSLDMSDLDDNEDYNIAVEIEYNDPDTEKANYPFTKIKMNVEKTSDDINGIILASFHFEDDEISNLVLKDIITIYPANHLNYLYSQGYIQVNSDVNRPFLGATYGADTSDDSFDITLPANPVIGDYFLVVDEKGTFNDNPVTLKRNGNKIMGKDEDYELDVDNLEYKIMFNGNDWRVL